MLFVFSLCSVRELQDLNAPELPGVHVIKYFKAACGHCQAIRPKFEAVSMELPNVAFFEFDCNKHPAECSSRGILSYPSIQLSADGRTFIYEGSQEPGPIQVWVELLIGPLFQEVGAEELQRQAQLADKPTFFILKTDRPAKYQALFQPYHGKCIIGLAAGAEEDELEARRNGKQISTQSLTKDAIERFISQHSIPIFSAVTRQNFFALAETAVPLVLVNGQQIAKELESLADKMQLTAQMGVLKDERVVSYIQRDTKCKSSDFIAAIHQRGSKKKILVASPLSGQPLDIQVVQILQKLEQKAIGINNEKTKTFAFYFLLGVSVSIGAGVALWIISCVVRCSKNAEVQKGNILNDAARPHASRPDTVQILNAVQE